MKKIKYFFITIFAIFLTNFGFTQNCSQGIFECFTPQNWSLKAIPKQIANEMRQHEIDFKDTNPNSWEILLESYPTLTLRKHKVYLGEVGENYQNILGGLYQFDVFTYPRIGADVTNGLASYFNWKKKDITWFCYNSKYDFDSSDIFNHFVFYKCPIDKIGRITLKKKGLYTIVGMDPIGRVRSTTYQSTTSYTNYPALYTTCESLDPDSFVGKCNASVRKYLKDMHTDGVDHTVTWNGHTYHYQNWWVRRMPCLPIECSSGPKGNCSMQVISPHFYISAAHWNSWVGGTHKYVSDDLAITNIVELDGNVVRLWQWTIDHTNEYGFTQQDIDSVGDMVIGQYTNGAVDVSICPYVIKYETLNKCFPIKNETNDLGEVTRFFHSDEYDDDDLAYDINVLGWTATQTIQGWVLPSEFTRRNSLSQKSIGMLHGFRADLSEENQVAAYDGIYMKIPDQNNLKFGMDRETYDIINSIIPEDRNFKFAPVWAGDSGLPSYLEYEGKFIILGQYLYTGGGPSYMNAFHVLKTYLESKGDTLKEFTYPD